MLINVHCLFDVPLYTEPVQAAEPDQQVCPLHAQTGSDDPDKHAASCSTDKHMLCGCLCV